MNDHIQYTIDQRYMTIAFQSVSRIYQKFHTQQSHLIQKILMQQYLYRVLQNPRTQYCKYRGKTPVYLCKWHMSGNCRFPRGIHRCLGSKQMFIISIIISVYCYFTSFPDINIYCFIQLYRKQIHGNTKLNDYYLKTKEGMLSR